MTKLVVCSKCDKKFTYKEVGNIYPGGKTKESINCPYCNSEESSHMTSGVFRSEKYEEN